MNFLKFKQLEIASKSTETKVIYHVPVVKHSRLYYEYDAPD